MKYMHMISRERGHSKGQGVGVKGRLELSQKFICFGDVWHPYAQLDRKLSVLVFDSFPIRKLHLRTIQIYRCIAMH